MGRGRVENSSTSGPIHPVVSPEPPLDRGATGHRATPFGPQEGTTMKMTTRTRVAAVLLAGVTGLTLTACSS